ncbi:response regulator transcription factor [Nocardia sp. NPDC006630]|uniref:response regulator transcription factor n=1 Tax=Nocardia sp. NPDC006630 TaxID=3157181 RepID=UPI0033B312C1
MIQIFIVDDNNIALAGLKSFLRNNRSMTVTGEARDMASALKAIDPKSVDIAIVGLELPDGSGIELCRRLQVNFPDIKCVIFSAPADAETLTRAALAGAFGYLTSNLPGETILQAMHMVSAGRLAFDQRLIEILIRHVRQSAAVDSALRELTFRELELFDSVGEGRSSQQIAERLGIAEKTVRNNLTKLYAKLGVENRNELVALSAKLREGLIRPQFNPQGTSSAA